MADTASALQTDYGIHVGQITIFATISAFLAEFRRAIAAEQCYESLKHSGNAALARRSLTRNGISRQVFDEFYR